MKNMKHLIRKYLNRKNKYKKKTKYIKIAYLKSKFSDIECIIIKKIYLESYKYNNFNIENYIILVF